MLKKLADLLESVSFEPTLLCDVFVAYCDGDCKNCPINNLNETNVLLRKAVLESRENE